jgi:hypothetical protein
MTDQTKVVMSVVCVGLGMAGLYLNIEYAGWVLFAGLLGVADKLMS